MYYSSFDNSTNEYETRYHDGSYYSFVNYEPDGSIYGEDTNAIYNYTAAKDSNGN